MPLTLPTFDQQFPANLLGVKLPSLGLSVVGIRVPAYKTACLRNSAWDWIEASAASIRSEPSIMAGDLNASPNSSRFRRILATGWKRGDPGGATFFGYKGRTSEIDHVLATSHCTISDARCIQDNAISDHAAVVCRVELEYRNARPASYRKHFPGWAKHNHYRRIGEQKQTTAGVPPNNFHHQIGDSRPGQSETQQPLQNGKQCANWR